MRKAAGGSQPPTYVDPRNITFDDSDEDDDTAAGIAMSLGPITPQTPTPTGHGAAMGFIGAPTPPPVIGALGSGTGGHSAAAVTHISNPKHPQNPLFEATQVLDKHISVLFKQTPRVNAAAQVPFDLNAPLQGIFVGLMGPGQSSGGEPMLDVDYENDPAQFFSRLTVQNVSDAMMWVPQLCMLWNAVVRPGLRMSLILRTYSVAPTNQQNSRKVVTPMLALVLAAQGRTPCPPTDDLVAATTDPGLQQLAQDAKNQHDAEVATAQARSLQQAASTPVPPL
jgi:hypothetical protein